MMKPTILIIVCLACFCEPAVAQPAAPAAHRNRADSLFSEGNMLDALAEYQRLYKLNPKDAQLVYNYACALSVDNAVFKGSIAENP